MNQSSKILAAAVLGLGVAVSALSATVLDADARAVAVVGDVAVERIATAFASLAPTEIEPAIQLAAARSRKGDLLVGPACDRQSWPQIASECLVSADGMGARTVRTVTVGYQTGEATTVLIRMPTPQVASR